MKFGDSLPNRRTLLRKLANTKSDKTFPLDFQGERKYLDVHSVSIDFPRYRLSNGRTGVDQLEYLAKNPSLPKDIFAKPESDQAQREQHNILKMMIEDAGLRSYFKTHKQLEPLVLDSEGFVINGNRRLCTMREYFYSSDKKKFAHFKAIDVVVLPPSDAKAILELENKLQLQKDIKQDYRWYNTAFMLKRRMAEKMDAREIQELYNVSTADLNTQLAMFDEAERYLSFQGKSGQFSAIPESKYAFAELVKALNTIGEDKKDSFLKLAYLVIEKADGRRAYDQIPKIARDLDRILEKVPTSTPAGKSPSGKATSIMLGKMPAAKPVRTPIPKLSNEKEKQKAREAIIDIIGAEDNRRRDLKKGDFVRVQLEKAIQSLESASNEISTSSDRKKLPPLIAQIDTIMKRLRQAIKK